jgi:hypothetical protein
MAESLVVRTKRDITIAITDGSDTYTVVNNFASTMSTSSDVETYTVQLSQEGSDFGESDITMTLLYCSLRGSRADGYPNTISISGTSFQLKPTIA